MSKWCQGFWGFEFLNLNVYSFWHIFFHSGVEFLYGFFVLGGAEVCVDFAGDLYAGVAEDALGG